jgi:hypothetical protein
VLEIGGIEALGEPAVDRGEEVVSLRAFVLIGPQSGKAGCCAEFQRSRFLAAGRV